MADDPGLSTEQRDAVRRAARGGGLAIVARAGSGKTRTLRAIAHERAPARTLLLAFNRVVAAEARARLPAPARATTVHALAYRATVGREPRLRAKLQQAATAGPDAWTQATGLDPRDPEAAGHVAAVRSVLGRFLADDTDRPDPRHVPESLANALRPALGPDRWPDRRTWLLRRAERLWARMTDPDDPTPLPHDGYLKLFSQRREPVPADVVLVDEAQDLAPVTVGWLSRTDAQIVLVGDPAQRIYGWRGAVDAMAASGHPEARLTTSFRFGADIAACAGRVLRVIAPGARIRGAGPAGRIRSDPAANGDGTSGPRAVLCRSTAGVLEAALCYADRGVAVVGGLADVLTELEAAHALRERRDRPGGPVVRGFDRWSAFDDAAEAQGGGLRSLRTLVDRYGDAVPAVAARLRASVRRDTEDAAVVISTVHRAKGREWDVVELWGDLPRVPADADALASAPDPDAARAEANLLYVAVTRARRELRLGRLREDLRRVLDPEGD